MVGVVGEPRGVGILGEPLVVEEFLVVGEFVVFGVVGVTLTWSC